MHGAPVIYANLVSIQPLSTHPADAQPVVLDARCLRGRENLILDIDMHCIVGHAGWLAACRLLAST